jgi:hypothetical protein
MKRSPRRADIETLNIWQHHLLRDGWVIRLRAGVRARTERALNGLTNRLRRIYTT